MFDLEASCGHLPLHSFEDGDLIIHEGRSVSALYFLKSGNTAAYRGSEKIDEINTPGAVFGDVSTLLDCPALLTTRSIGLTHFYVADNPEDFLLAHPEIALHVARDLARKLHFSSTYLTDLKEQYARTDQPHTLVNEVLDSFLHRTDV